MVAPTSEGLSLVREAAARIAAQLPLTSQADVFDLSNRHTGAKSERYRRAAEDYLQSGLYPADSNVKMFVKAERFDPNAKCRPDPRAIQYRGTKYCVALSQYLRPIEEHIYQIDFINRGVTRTRNVAKGLNSVARAEILASKLLSFDDPMIIGLDASRFDKHVSQGLLKLEHWVYCQSNSEPEFAELLKRQLVNKCYTSQGIKYVTRGRRMSGDMNTASGNVLLMLMMILAYMDLSVRIRKWDCFDDGDDALVIIEGGDFPLFTSRFNQVWTSFGMTMKVEEPCRSLHEVEFCQSKVIEYQMGRYKFVRDYRTVMSKAASGIRNWSNRAYRFRVLKAIGMCELILNLGVPVLQEYALALLRNSGGGSPDVYRYASDGLKARVRRELQLLGVKSPNSVCAQPIENVARETFYIAFGLSIPDQLQLERRLAQWVFEVDEQPLEVGPEWDFSSWSGRQTVEELYHLLA